MKIPVIQILANGGMMGGLTYIQVLAVDVGVDATRVGVLVFAYSLAFFMANIVFGRASDMQGRRKFIWLGLGTAALSFILVALADGFWSLLITRTLTGLCIGIFPPALVAYTIEARKKLNRFASYGSIGWGLGVLILGFAAQLWGVRWVFALASLFFALAFAAALALTPVKFERIQIPRFPAAIIKRNGALYSAVLIRHSGAVMVWTFWPLFMMEEIGLDLFQIAIIQATNMLTQFAFMFALGDRLPSRTSLVAGLLLTTGVFISISFAQNFWQLWATQFALAASWAFLYVGALVRLDERNVEKATANGLFTSVIALSAIIGPLIATGLIQFMDYRGLMYVAAVLALVSVGVFLAMDRDKKKVTKEGRG